MKILQYQFKIMIIIKLFFDIYTILLMKKINRAFYFVKDYRTHML